MWPVVPTVHAALVAVTTLSGIDVKNRSDVAGKMYCVYHLCDSILKNVFELYCNLKAVLIKYLAIPAVVLSLLSRPSGLARPSPHTCGRGTGSIP